MKLSPLDSSVVPRFAEPATFMRAPYLREGYDQVEVALVGVPFDMATNRNGARQGPAQIREMSRLIRRVSETGAVSPFDLCSIADIGDAPFSPLDHMGSIEAIAEFFARLSAAGVAVVAAGGDHAITYPILKGIAGTEPLGLVHIDAHPDTYDEFMGNRYNHATPLRRGIEEGFIDPRRVVSVGLRGTRFSADDRSFNDEQQMRVITMDEYESLGREAVIEEIRRVVGDGPTYVTYDIDALDTPYCVGTGAPEPGGLSMRDSLVLLRGLRGLEIVGGDVAEVSPPLDPSGHTALNAANLMFELLCLTCETVARARGTELA